MGRYGRGRHRGTGGSKRLVFQFRQVLELAIWLVVWLAFAWAFTPGVGPDLAGLQGRGWPVLEFRIHPVDISDLPPTPLSQALQKLRIRPDSSSKIPRYKRQEFGSAWQDMDANGCDTRNDILARDLQQASRGDSDTAACVIEAGWLADPYSGNPVYYQRGPDTSNLVQIDHVVALRDAWDSGAWQWKSDRRVKYANDPLVLLAVSGWTNRDKRAATAAQWLPPNQGYHCEYVARQIAIKSRYGLSVSIPEFNALVQVIRQCPHTDLPG